MFDILIRARYYSQFIALGLMAVMSQHSWAGSNPLPFNQWTVSNGAIDASATCSTAGVTCTVLAEDKGFLQQQVITADGSYVQMILTEANASGSPESLGFTTENFIPDNNLSGFDIANLQVIRDPDQNFEQIAQIDRAPFIDPTLEMVDLIHVDLLQTLNEADFTATFHLAQHEAELPGGEILTGKNVSIQQEVTESDSNARQILAQSFHYQESSGNQLINATDTLMIDPFTKASVMQVGDQAVGIHDGDTIKIIEIAQNFAEIPSEATFTHTAFSNKTQEITLSDTTIIDPFIATP